MHRYVHEAWGAGGLLGEKLRALESSRVRALYEHPCDRWQSGVRVGVHLPVPFLVLENLFGILVVGAIRVHRKNS